MTIPVINEPRDADVPLSFWFSQPYQPLASEIRLLSSACEPGEVVIRSPTGHIYISENRPAVETEEGIGHRINIVFRENIDISGLAEDTVEDVCPAKETEEDTRPAEKIVEDVCPAPQGAARDRQYKLA